MGGWLNRIRLYKEFKKVDQHLRENGFHEKLASQLIFSAAGWTADVSTRLQPGVSYLIYSAHRHFLDSCAANLILPDACRSKRIVNAQVARSFGPLYCEQNFSTLARFNRRWLVHNCYDWTSRFFYCASSGWFHAVPVDPDDIVNWLRAGNCLITFPTGVLGSARWRRGIGQLVNNYLDHEHQYQLPLRLVGLKIDFNFRRKQVNVSVVSNVPARSCQSIVTHASATPVDIQLTERLERDYAIALHR